MCPLGPLIPSKGPNISFVSQALSAHSFSLIVFPTLENGELKPAATTCKP